MCLNHCKSRIVSLAVVLVLVFSPHTGQADDKPAGKAKAAPEIVRMVYPVHGSSAKELTEALRPHFSGSWLVALPGTGNKNLVLSGPKDDVREALRLLQELDRPAQTIHVDVFLVEMAAKGAGSTELSGPMGKVVARLHELQQEGKVGSVTRIELTVLEGDTGKVLIGAYKPYVTGVTRFAGMGAFGGGEFGPGSAAGGGRRGTAGKGATGKGAGKSDAGPGGAPGAGGAPGDDRTDRIGPPAGAMARTVSYRNLGTQVQIIKPAITADGLVELQIHVEDSQPRKTSGGVDLFSDERGAGVPATEFNTFTFEDRLRIPRGNIVTAQSTQTNSRNSQGQTLILVGVRGD